MAMYRLEIQATSVTDMQDGIAELHRRFQATSMDPTGQAAAADMEPSPRGRPRKPRGGGAAAGGQGDGLASAASGGAAGTHPADAAEQPASEGAAVDAVEGTAGAAAPESPAAEDQVDGGAAEADARAGEPLGGDREEDQTADLFGAGEGEGEGQAPAEGEGVTGNADGVEEEPAREVTVDEMVAAGRALAASKGFGAIDAIMSTFKVSRMSDVPEDQRADFLQAIEAAS